MTLPVFPAAAVAFLAELNGEAYDAESNPFGLANGGHRPNFPLSMTDSAIVANYLNLLSIALEALAEQVSLDAASAAAGSGTEATVEALRSGVSAFYSSVRRVYAANAPVALTDGASISWDMSAAINVKVTLAGSRAFANPTNKVIGKSGFMLIRQDSIGGHSPTFGSDYVWLGGEPVWPAAANARSLIAYVVDEDGKVLLSFGGSTE